MILRDYQQRAIDDLYSWFGSNVGNPCLVLPTGAGKSLIIAALCRDAIQQWPETRILMMSHVKELIEQNAEKMRAMWPGAPLGIYSASLRKRNLEEPITFAGIQSVRNKSKEIGHVDLVIIDECHLVNHKAEGGYRTLIEELTTINPELRVIGLTATPHRLGHGLITDKPAIFDDLLESVTIEELIHKGYLANLRSKVTKEKLSTDGVHKRGGDFIESELQAAVDTDAHNMAVVDEVIGLAGNRRHWLFFCAGVQHAVNIRDQLRLRGISAETVTGETPQGERAQIIADFKAGKIQALTNANVLTTGFDAPNIDLIAMLRPTMSPSLYIQMAGRGLRQKTHTDHCLVLDFAGVVETHGPITNVRPPKKASEEKGEAPVKDCPECGELVHISVMMCPACGHAFPEKEAPDLKLGDVDIMGLEGTVMNVSSWIWREHTSRTSGKQMVKVTYYGALSDAPVTEYMAVLHDGFAGQKAARELAKMASEAGVAVKGLAFAELAHTMTSGTPPSQIEYFKEGKFYRVKSRKWSNDYASRRA